MKPKMFGLITSSLLFLIFVALALAFQSTTYLYIASAGPLLIVPFLPDIRTNQFIKSKETDGAVRLIRMKDEESGGADLLVILFDPGFVRWNSRKLYFNPDEASLDVYAKPGPYNATLTVLSHDLSIHPRKKSWIGVSLAQLEQRTAQLSFTTNEINRLVIRMSDMNELLKMPQAQRAVADHSLGA